MKDDEVWEKRETNIYAQMKLAEKVKETACVRVCVCVHYVNERACAFGVAAQQLV